MSCPLAVIDLDKPKEKHLARVIFLLLSYTSHKCAVVLIFTEINARFNTKITGVPIKMQSEVVV